MVAMPIRRIPQLARRRLRGSPHRRSWPGRPWGTTSRRPAATSPAAWPLASCSSNP